MKKRILSLILTVAMVISILPTGLIKVKAGTLDYDISQGSLTLQDGDGCSPENPYVIYGNTTSNSITVSSGTHYVTLKNASISTNNTGDFNGLLNAINVDNSAVLHLTIEGSNSIITTSRRSAAIRVAPNAELTISGDGSLSAQVMKDPSYSRSDSAAIGGNGSDYFSAGEKAGKITINSGTLSLSARGGAGIGGGGQSGATRLGGDASTVIINGGIISLTSEEGAAIGSGRGAQNPTNTSQIDNGSSGNIYINGGTIIANSVIGGINVNGIIGGGYRQGGADVVITGGSIQGTTFSKGPGDNTMDTMVSSYEGSLKNNAGNNLKLYTLTLENVTSKKNVSSVSFSTNYGYAITDVQTDADGKLYFYLPDSEAAATVNVVTATGTYIGQISSQAATLMLQKYDATVTANKNGSAWTDVSSNQIVLSTSGTDATAGQKTATLASGVFTFSGIDPTATMYVWAKNSTGTYVNVGSVTNSSTSATVNYYDVNLTKGTGIASVTGAGTYLSGETANISATLSTGYIWSKWSDNNTTMTNRSLTVNKKYDLTANATLTPATAPTVSTTGATLDYGYLAGSISVTATPADGHTITGYQWYTCGSDGSGKSKVTGATSAAYNIPTGNNAGSYYYVCDVTTTRTDNSQTKTVTTSPPTLVTVNKSAITVTMNNKSRNYGEANPTLDFAITSGSLENSDTNTDLAVTGATSATQTSNVGTYDITGTSTSTNYDVTINKGTLTINKKTSASTDFIYDLTSKTYNGNAQGVSVTPKTGTGTITVYYEGVSPTSYTKSTTPPTTPGTYKITINVTDATNYSDTTNLNLGNYTINKADVASLTLTSSNNTSTYGDEVTFTATVTKAGNEATPTGNIVFKNGETTLATVALVDGVTTLKKSDLGAATHTITAEYGGDSNYNTKTSAPLTLVVNQKPVNFTLTGQEQVYDGTAKGISIDDTGTLLTESDFSIKYYLVDENEDVLESTTPVTKAVSPAKYLYVIDFAGTNANYQIKNKFEVSNTTLPTLSSYDNVGYMMIKSQTAQQKPIYFGEGIINKLVGDNKFTNPLTNENASSVTYSSTNTNVATVNSTTGEVTILKDGSATIMAKSTLSGTADVFASYSLVVAKKQVTITAQDKTHTFGTAWDTSNGSVTYSDGLSVNNFSGTLTFTTNYTNGGRVGEYKITPSGLTSDKYSIIYESATLTVNPKTLAANDFNVTARDKVYDGTDKVTLNASIISGLYSTNSVKAEIEGSFTSASASDSANVSYKITGLTGVDADNYVLGGGSITGTVAAKIEKATVSIICASTTTKTFDGNAQTVDVSAMANGNIFDSSNYTVKYDGKDSASGVGIYPITVVLNDDVKDNYTVQAFTATLTIKEATQDVFSVEGIPDRVYYGDSFKVSSQGANGEVSYTLNDGAPATINNGNFIATGTGMVTITATSTKDGYTNKTATKIFTVYPRVLTPTATATDRVYNAQNGVDVTIGLENMLATDNVAATGVGVMANADAGTGKIVYVSNIKLEGGNKDFYTLSGTTLQTSVNIDKATVTGFDIKAYNKTYDGDNMANADIIDMKGVIESDKEQVSIQGVATFDNATANIAKTVTYTATELTGAKASNYKFEKDTAKISTTTANILPMNIKFTIGTATFKYDGEKKSVITSGTDELGRVFTDYTVEYWKNNAKLDIIPIEAGDYTIRLVLNDNVNYATTQSDVQMTIAQASQEQITIVGLPGNIEYLDTFTLEEIGGSGTGDVEWKSDNSNVTVDSSGNVKVDGAVNEKVTITATKKDDTNFTEKSAKVVFIPTAKTVSFTLGDLSQTYDENDKQISVIPSINNATYDVAYNGLSALPVHAGTYNVVVAANGNYKGTANTTLTIGKAKMSGLRVSQNGCTYGDTLMDATFDTAPNGVNVRVQYSTLDGKKPAKAGDYIVTATYTGDNYETFVVSSEFKIEKKLLTVKANDKTRKYGEANPVFTLIFDGFVNDENESVLLSEPAATTVATASSPVNDYEITVSGGRADNYSFNYDNSGKLKVAGAVGGNFYITGSNNTVTVGDIFTLHAYYDNAQPNVSWESSDDSIATIDMNGIVTILKKGDATITATITDANYENGISAAFKLNASKKAIQLKPADLVKVYNAERQDIALVSDDANFIPTLSGENKNIDITYTLTTDSSVTEPKQAGVYTVTYSINHPSYTGGETVTMYINKATATVSAQDLTKVYGGKTPAYCITGLIGADETNTDYIAKITGMFDITSDADSTGSKTNVGEYPITLAVKNGKTLNNDGNYNLVISDAKGKLTVTKAPLTVKVSDASREYGAENANPAYEYVGFVNDETENALIAKPVFAYTASVSRESNIGNYPDVITASGAESNNYEISYSYTDGTGASLTISKLPVTVSAGTAKSNYLTVNFSKEIAGLTRDSFTVMLGGAPADITSVSANSANTAYTLNGSFKTGSEYAVTVTVSDNYELAGLPLTIAPKSSSRGGGGGSSGSVTTSYKITVTQADGGKITPDTVSVNENGSKTFTITPNDGYEIEDVLADGKSVGAVKEYTFDKVMASATITAKFKKIEEPTPTPELTEWENSFTDVTKNDWFYDAVKFANENGLMSGTSETVFAPNSDVTRAMFVTVLYRMEKEPNVNGAPFTDIENGAYYAKAVAWAAENGIVKGISEIEFVPNDNITREQMAAIIQRYAKFKGVDISVSGKTEYTDNASVSNYAKDAVVWASHNGIMTGNTDGSFAPQDNSTRAETAVVLQRFFGKLK